MLIGLLGRARAGKSTAAWRLIRAHGFTLVKFAQPLKDALVAMGLSQRMIEGDLKEHPIDMLCGKTPRWAMQSLGTDWGRKMVGDDLWVRLWQWKVAGLLGSGIQHVVVDDVRFENEAEAINEMGGYLVKITRPGAQIDEAKHASELELERINCQIVIENEGTITDLEATIDGTRQFLANHEADRSKMLQGLRKEAQL